MRIGKAPAADPKFHPDRVRAKSQLMLETFARSNLFPARKIRANTGCIPKIAGRSGRTPAFAWHPVPQSGAVVQLVSSLLLSAVKLKM